MSPLAAEGMIEDRALLRHAVHHHAPPAMHARAVLAAHPMPGTAAALLTALWLVRLRQLRRLHPGILGRAGDDRNRDCGRCRQRSGEQYPSHKRTPRVWLGLPGNSYQRHSLACGLPRIGYAGGDTTIPANWLDA